MSAQQKKPQFIHGQPSTGLPFQKELVVDLFAGGGGASTGIAQAYREPDVAETHNQIALNVHRANHKLVPCLSLESKCGICLRYRAQGSHTKCSRQRQGMYARLKEPL
jgi:site-specific DNA-cytosine methylase